MKVRIISESGYFEALFGLGLSYGLTSGMEFGDFLEDHELIKRLHSVATKLALKGNGENKFLRQIQVIIDVNASRFWWPECDQYKVATVTQSESTMHSLTKRPFSMEMFDTDNLSVPGRDKLREMIAYLNDRRENYLECDSINKALSKDAWYTMIHLLPACWLQRRILSCNYATLQNIYNQRHNHKLREWHVFCDAILRQAKNPEFIAFRPIDVPRITG